MRVTNWTNDRIIIENTTALQHGAMDDLMEIFSQQCSEWNLETVEITERGGILLYNATYELYYEVSRAKIRDYTQDGKCIVRGFKIANKRGA